MIKIENTVTPSPEQWESIILATRNPMNSWDKSDSGYCGECYPWEQTCEFVIGKNDLTLMKKLAKAGTDHRKFVRMIVVYVDITAPLYWWSEFDTYKVGTVANSCSKMHKLLARPFEMSDFSFDKLFGYKHEIKQFRPDIDERTEIWRCVQDCSDYYVSNQGRVKHNGRILSGSLHQDGYIFVTIHGIQRPLHRLIATVFCKTYPGCNEVNHIDGNKQNNFYTNLEWVTRSQNQKHAVDNGLQPKGLSTYKGKFTYEQREQIKQEWDSGKYSRRELAKKYGVSHTCINDIINDKYKYAERTNVYEEVARPLVDTLNELRDSWLTCENESDKKQIWYSILQLLPTSYNQKRTITLNYEVLVNMYFARKDHKLDEWHTFCDWIRTLPYMKDILDAIEG